MNNLSHYVLPEHTNTLYENEASSSIALTRDIATQINAIIDRLNELSQNDIEWKQTQEGTIRKGVIYMKDNLINSLNDLMKLLIDNGFIDNRISANLSTFSSNIDELSNRLNVAINSVSNNSEIIDGRVGLYKSYENIGTAIRTQLQEIYNTFHLVINAYNLLKDPMLLNNIWTYDNDAYTIIKGDFYNALQITPTTNTTSFHQNFSPLNVESGTYNFEAMIKTSASAYINVGVIGYPTQLNSGGTLIDSISNANVTSVNNYSKFTFNLTLPVVHNYDHLRFFILTRTQGVTYKFSEMILAKNDGLTNFSYAKDMYKQFENQNVNPLFNKKLVVNGDSICSGEGYVGGYAGIIASENNMAVQNIAVSGATIVSGTTYPNGFLRHHISTSMAQLDNDGDFYIIEGGFNDSGNNVNPNASAFTDIINENSIKDNTKFLDAMETICTYLAVNCRGKKVGFIFPHKINNNDNRVEANNTYNYSWKNYRDLAKKVLLKYGIPFLDLSEVSSMNTAFTDIANEYTLNGDRVHPNEDGYKKYYVPKITAWLKTL